MPQLIDVPGHGEVEFPDDMSDEQIAAAIQPTMLPKPSGGPGALSRFGAGLMDQVYGIGQMVSRAMEATPQTRALKTVAAPFQQAAGIPTDIDQAIREREQAYQASRGPAAGMDWARVAGNVVSPALAVRGAGMAASLPQRILAGAKQGAVSQAVMPVTGDDFVADKAAQVGLGAATGAAAGPIADRLARVISPLSTRAPGTLAAMPPTQAVRHAQDVQALLSEGVQLMPGQIAGGAARRIEEAATSMPIAGDVIRAAQRRGIESFDRAVINRALAPIGEKLPDDVPMGNEAVERTYELISRAYDKVKPNLRLQADARYTNELATVRGMAQNMHPAYKRQFENILKNEVDGKFTPHGLMSGEQYKGVDAALGQLARKFGRSQDANQNLLGDALQETQAILRRMALRQNPQAAPQLRAADAAFAQYRRIENAAARQGAKEGIFTPAQYSAAVRAVDASKNKRAFAQGRAMGQEFSTPAESVLAKTVPDSGTPLRLFTNLGAGGVGAAYTPDLLGTALGIGAAYTRPGQWLLRNALTARPGFAEPSANLLQSALVPAGALALPPTLNDAFQR